MVLLAASPSHGQISYTGVVVFQDFDTLPAAGTFTFSTKGPQALDQTPINAAGAVGWSLYANVGTPLSFIVDAGGSSTASVYSYGTSGTSERALGFLANSTRACRAGLRLINNTGQTLTQFTLSFTGEEWRSGGTVNPNSLAVDYRIQAAAFDIDSGGTYTAIPALTFNSPVNHAQSTAVNGNLAANRVLLSATINASWPNGQMLMVRWRDSDSTGEDDALAIDDVAFFAPTSGAVAPQVLSMIPASSATGVITTRRLAVVFNQPVTTTGTWAQLTDENSAAVPATIAGGPIRYEVTPASRLLPGKSYTLTVLGAQVTNSGGTPMSGNVTSAFTTLPSITNPQLISAVQGNGATTPMAGQVVTVTGVITADYQGPPPALGGFFIQSLPAGEDGDPATSEGLFIYDFASEGTAAVAVGDVVTLTGTASEFSSQTQISNVISLVITGTTPLPAFVDAALPMTSSTGLEALEGMRVRFPQTLHVASSTASASFSINYARNGELILSSDGPLIDPTEIVDPNDDPPSGTSSTGNSNAAAVTAQAAANTLRTLVLDDASNAIYPDPTPYLNASGTRRSGDTVTGLSGILSAAGGSYRVQPVGTVTFVDANPRPVTPPAVAGRIRVAAMNVLNYFTTFGGTNDRGASNAAEFQRQKDKVIAALSGLNADVLGLIEIQNTPAAINDILTALNAAVAPNTYVAAPDPSGGASGDFIRCVLLYRPSRISTFGPCYSDPADIVWNTPNPLRYPLAQVFVENSTGERFIACLNHWKSKSSSGATGADVDQNDGQGSFNDQRRRQAARLLTWLQTIRTFVGEDDVLILGDLNSFGEEDPLDVLRAAGCADQGTRFHPGDYSYRLGETRGRLDHAFATATMATQIIDADHWHINADEPAFYDYNTENKTAAQLLVNVGTPFRSSDHDPVIIGINLTPQPTTFAMWAAARTWPGGTGNQPTDDPDLDGMTNLEEFALNTDPLASDTPLAPVASIIGGNFQLLYRLRTNASGITVQPQWSPDLVNWFPMTPGTPLTLDSITSLQPASTPLSGSAQRFGRLKIDMP